MGWAEKNYDKKKKTKRKGDREARLLRQRKRERYEETEKGHKERPKMVEWGQ